MASRSTWLQDDGFCSAGAEGVISGVISSKCPPNPVKDYKTLLVTLQGHTLSFW